jgi:antitoxin HicB
MSTSSVGERDVRHYLDMPYRIVLLHDETRDDLPWRAKVEDLPGCEAAGGTPVEAAERVPAAVAEWVGEALAEGREVPEPRTARDYSGKLLLRMPRTMHAALAQAAETEQVSLNAYITNQLAVVVGWRKPDPPPAAPSRSPAPAPAGDGAGEPSQTEPAPASRWQAPGSTLLLANLAVVGVAVVIALLLLLTAWNVL